MYAVRVVARKDNDSPSGAVKVYGIVHVDHDVYAGYSTQLPGAIKACRELNEALIGSA